ncbi:Asp-tRNA(Asn)/Glu-tRNA(Gln) amidotransferase subunit GatC [Alkaliphilus crotonatoxidans]
MEITREEVQYIAKLAKLRLTEAEAEKMAKEFEAILGHFQSIDRLELNDSKAVDLKPVQQTVLREDQATIFKDKKKLFKNAKKVRQGYIEVPRIIE